MGKKGHKRGASAERSAGGKRLIIGRNGVAELLTHCPERIERVFVGVAKGEGSPRRRELLERILELGIEINEVEPSYLDSLVGSDSHQSFAAQVSASEPVDLKDFLVRMRDQARAVVLALDSITDPQNLGSIIRAACCFNASAVLLSRNRGAGITPAATKASVGATEMVPIIEVSNLAEALRRFRESGFWIAVAEAETDGEMVNTFSFPEKVVFVLGSEGYGVQDLIKRTADYKLFIPMPGKVKSLNVSQAAAVMLYAMTNPSKDLHRSVKDIT